MKENHGRWTAINILVLLLLQFSQSFGSPPPTSADFQYESKHKVILILMVILVCLMSIFFATACFSIYLHQRGGGRQMPRNFNLTEDGSLTEERLDPDVLNAFPTFIYSEVKGLKIGKGALECAVCLNEFEDDDTLRLLPNCSHVFHCDCIDVWLSSNITCPVCRANVSHSPFPLLTHDLGTEASRDCRNQNSDPVTDELIITIQSPDIIQSAIPTNSTSGSVVKPAEDCDRFKLRLPEEVRSRLVRTSLSRTKSSVALPRAMSLRNGYRSSSVGTGRGNKNFFHNERPDKCEFTGQPQSLSRPTSVRRPKVNGGGSGGEGGGRVRVGGGGGDVG